MTRALFVGVLTVSAVTTGCRQDTDDARALEVPPTVVGDENLVRPEVVIVEGCLTAAGERFVLTELEHGVAGPRVAARGDGAQGTAPEPTTEAYRLVGMEPQLKPLVGQRVEITGEAEPERVVDFRRTTPPFEPANTPARGTSGADPAVAITETARLEISDLRVRSVADVGGRCAAGRDAAPPR